MHLETIYLTWINVAKKFKTGQGIGNSEKRKKNQVNNKRDQGVSANSIYSVISHYIAMYIIRVEFLDMPPHHCSRALEVWNMLRYTVYVLLAWEMWWL